MKRLEVSGKDEESLEQKDYIDFLYLMKILNMKLKLCKNTQVNRPVTQVMRHIVSLYQDLNFVTPSRPTTLTSALVKHSFQKAKKSIITSVYSVYV